jgi:hypothetical protein
MGNTKKILLKDQETNKKPITNKSPLRLCIGHSLKTLLTIQMGNMIVEPKIIENNTYIHL